MNLMKLVKEWTLPMAMFSGTLIYLVFAYTPCLESTATALAPYGDACLPLCMYMVLFVTFCKVDFHRMRPVAWHCWVCIFQLAIIAAGTGLVLAFHLTGSSLTLMEALLCCCTSPCATAAAVVCAKLGGDIEEMSSYAVFSNFLTALVVPFCFPLIDPAADIPFWDAFMKILREVCLVLLSPMLLAYIVKHGLPRLHRRIISVRDLAYYLWGCSLMMVTGTTVRNICHAQTDIWFLMAIALLGLMICIVQFAVGRFIGHYFNRVLEAGQGLGQKNTTFGIWTAQTYLTPLSSVGPGCYILWQNIINSFEIWLYRKRGLERFA